MGKKKEWIPYSQYKMQQGIKRIGTLKVVPNVIRGKSPYTNMTKEEIEKRRKEYERRELEKERLARERSKQKMEYDLLHNYIAPRLVLGNCNRFHSCSYCEELEECLIRMEEMGRVIGEDVKQMVKTRVNLKAILHGKCEGYPKMFCLACGGLKDCISTARALGKRIPQEQYRLIMHRLRSD